MPSKSRLAALGLGLALSVWPCVVPAEPAPTALTQAADALSRGDHATARRLALLPGAPAESLARAMIAGRASFALADYPAAVSYLEAALSSTDPALPEVQDVALFFLAESHFRLRDRATALVHVERLLAVAPGSPWAARARARRADCRLALGATAEAAEAFRVLLEESRAETKKASARYSHLEPGPLAYAIARAQDEPTRAVTLLDIYISYPTDPVAEEARLRLGGAPALSPGQRAARIKALFEARAYEPACAEARAFEEEAHSDDSAWWAGRCQVQAGDRFGGALLMLRGSGFGDPAATTGDIPRLWQTIGVYTGASGAERAEGYTQARALIHRLEAVAPTTEEAKKARYKAAWLDYHEGDYPTAAAGFERILATDPSHEDARWYAAWSRYLAGDLRGALPHLDKLAAGAGPLTAGKGRYWKARALAQLGESKAAKALYQGLRDEWPLSYYAALARLQLKEAPPKGTPAPKPAPASYEDLPPVAPALLLGSWGLHEEALAALRVRESAALGADKAAGALRLCGLYLALGGYRRAFELSVGYQKEALAAPPTTPEALDAWRCAYPRAYQAETEEAARAFGVDPLYLYALMQKESAYDPWALSYADAYGLLQLLPKTAATLATDLGEPVPAPSALFGPAQNLRLAASYVSRLERRFQAQLPLVSAAYNGGPGAVSRWLQESGARPFDEFVEQITYAQSREYLKKTVELYARYRLLYDGAPSALPASLRLEEDTSAVTF